MLSCASLAICKAVHVYVGIFYVDVIVNTLHTVYKWIDVIVQLLGYLSVLQVYALPRKPKALNGRWMGKNCLLFSSTFPKRYPVIVRVFALRIGFSLSSIGTAISENFQLVCYCQYCVKCWLTVEVGFSRSVITCFDTWTINCFLCSRTVLTKTVRDFITPFAL